MELIKCPACGHEISMRAISCPNCGEPIKSNEEVVYTIQQTQKRWKLVKVIGGVVTIICLLSFLGGLAEGNSIQMGVSFSIGFISFIVLLIGKIGAWWTTG